MDGQCQALVLEAFTIVPRVDFFLYTSKEGNAAAIVVDTVCAVSAVANKMT
jgi:hypothetical protein